MVLVFYKITISIIQPIKINKVMPTFDNIVNGSYAFLGLYFFILKDHLKYTKGMKKFIREVVSEDAIGEDGYLLEKGLIPMNNKEFKETRKKVLKSL